MTNRLVLLALLGCSHSAPPPPALPAHVLDGNGTLLVGDLHGTREIPAFVGHVVATLAADRPVVLALEILRDETPSTDAFLASDGRPAAKQALLADAWWRQPYQDGRRSVAMYELFETVRALRARGARVELARFDWSAPSDNADERDQRMAENVVALRKAHPDAALVVYAGNLHTMRKGMPSRPGYTWMAGHLARAGIAFVTLAPRYAEGSAWICRGSQVAQCGPGLVAGGDDPAGTIRLEPSPDGNYDGWFGVGPVTASPPAAFPEAAAALDAQLAALRSSPEAWRVRALRAYKANDFAACAAEYARIDPATADDAYNHACCLAKAGRKDEAFARLDFALAHGFADLAGAAGDPDLAALHDDPRWPPKPR